MQSIRQPTTPFASRHANIRSFRPTTFSLSPEKLTTPTHHRLHQVVCQETEHYIINPKSSEVTIQSNTRSISNSSVHNTNVASRSYYLEKPDFSFRNQAQSDYSFTATSTPKQGLRSLGPPSRGNENESLFSPRSSIYSLATDPSPNSNPIYGAPPSPPVGATPSLPPPTDRIDTTSLDPRLIEDDLPLRPSAEPGEARAHEGRVLESKVARLASKECSVEEVIALLREVDHWLMEVTAADQSTALVLSSMLLKVILANHVASASLSSRVDEVAIETDRLGVQIHKQVILYSQKVQECQDLRTELSRLTSPAVSMASPAESAHADLSSSSRPSSPPSSSVTPRTSSPSYISNLVSPLSRLGLTRSASVAPTPPVRSASIAPISSSRTASTVPARASSPGISSASHRSATSAVPSFRSRAPASLLPPPPPPPLPRPIVISRASTAAEEMERERERRRRQSNENRGRETPAHSVPVVPTSSSRMTATIPRSTPPTVPSYRSSTPTPPSPVRKSRTMSQPPLLPGDRWPAALTATITKPFAPPAAPRPLGPRVSTRA